SHRKIPFQSFLATEESSDDESQIIFRAIQAIRSDRTKPLEDRLRLCNLLLSDEVGRGKNTSWNRYLENLESHGQITTVDKEYLVTVPYVHKDSKEPGGEGILILPFHPMPLSSSHLSIAFAGQDFFAPQKNPILFSFSEIDQL